MAKQKVRKAIKRSKKAKKPKKASLTKLKEKLWELCKQIARQRAKTASGDIFCYTCGKRLDNPSDQHTAHFIASSICGAGLRFDLQNLRVCCYVCNVHMSGNWPAYLERMIAEVGQEKVDELLKRRNETTKADRIFYENLIAEYALIKDVV